MKRQQSQPNKKKTCKPKSKESKVLSGKMSKKKPKNITKAMVIKVISLKNAQHATQMNLLDFPDEILLKFQSFLNYRSMCQCVETCTKLNQVYGDPSLWADMPVKRGKIIRDGMKLFKDISRFSVIKHINLYSGPWFTTIKPGKLTEAIEYVCWRNENGTSLETLNLTDTNCSTKQLMSLLSSFTVENSMKRLNLTRNNLQRISPELLKKAICCVEDVNLSETWLTIKHLTALSSFGQNKKILKRIDLSDNELDEVAPELLTFCCFEDVNLSTTNLTTTQITTLFSSNLNTKIMKRIDLSDNRLEEVSPELLKEAICCFQDVNLSHCDLTLIQLTDLVSFIPTKNTLKKIDLSRNDLKRVCPELLKAAVCCIEDVNLSRNGLTSEQLTPFFSSIPTRNTLKRVDLSDNNLRKVSPQLLKEAIYCVEEANLSATNLATTQLGLYSPASQLKPS